jgi:cytoskeletal protein CcmA (bactofilin family)
MHQVEIDIDAIQNRIGEGSASSGTLICPEGLLIQGTFSGQLIVVDGPLVVLDGGSMSGNIHCDGDVYLLGRVTPPGTGETSQITSSKAVHLGISSNVVAQINAPEVITYEGAVFEGKIT